MYCVLTLHHNDVITNNRAMLYTVDAGNNSNMGNGGNVGNDGNVHMDDDGNMAWVMMVISVLYSHYQLYSIFKTSLWRNVRT